MLGSNQSIAGPNITINTIVADVLKDYADILEKADDFNVALDELLQKSVSKSKNVVFNGNNYSDEWVAEAARRGLPNLKTTPEALAEYTSEKNVKLFERHNIFTPAEMDSRYEIHLEDYNKTINIEALTMLNLAKREISPAVVTYTKEVVDTLVAKKSCGSTIDVSAETTLSERLSALFGSFIKAIDALEETLAEARNCESAQAQANYSCEKIIPAMETLRVAADSLEEIVAEKYWPFPTYEDILFYV